MIKKTMFKCLVSVTLVLAMLLAAPLNAFAGTALSYKTGAKASKVLASPHQDVLDAQNWLNSTYKNAQGYTQITADGTSYSATYEALTKAFQIELVKNYDFSSDNITGFFGPLTTAACPTFEIGKANNSNMVKILQYALRCKAYPAKVNGVFDATTQTQIKTLQSDAGLTSTQIVDKATPTICAAILTVEVYKPAAYGYDQNIRTIQQNINRDYLQYLGIQPTDGVYGPSTVRSIIYALQMEEGIPTDITDKDDPNFGPTTKRLCPDIPYSGAQKNYNGNTYSTAAIKRITYLLQYSLYCYYANINASTVQNFSGTMDADTISKIKMFQQFAGLQATEKVTVDEWMGLLVSTGNPDRTVTATDTWQRLTKEKAQSLKAQGFDTVGRYLTGDLIMDENVYDDNGNSVLVKNTSVAKNLLRSEMKDIFDSGLNLFLIYQDYKDYFKQHPDIPDVASLSLVYYNYDQGYKDAEKAFSVAKSLGTPRGEYIYFATDFDFSDDQVNSMIIPYFHGICDYTSKNGNLFKIGIYGSRQACILTSAQGYTTSSFVSDMSTGYAGNIAHKLPDNWAFDQVANSTASSTDGSFDVDNDGTPTDDKAYKGFNHFETTSDNEWDNFTGQSHVAVLVPKDTVNSVDVYWSKTVDSNGAFSEADPMYDKLYSNSVFIYKDQSVSNKSTNDNIRYIYFRDKGGHLNAGYVDFNILNKDFTVEPYCSVDVFRGGINGNGKLYTNVSDSYKGQFYLSAPLDAYDISSKFTKTLPTGTKVQVDTSSLSDPIYTDKIMCDSMQTSDGTVENEKFLLDLGITYGVLPTNRVIITDNSVPYPSDSVESVSILPSSTLIGVDQTATFTVTVNPSTAGNKNVKWQLTGTLANGDIAVIDSSDNNTCVVRGKNAGIATLKVTTDEGGYSAEVTINVGQVLLGDTNLDGSVNLKDATLIQKYLAKMTSLTPGALSASDANEDGIVALKDVTLIQKYLAKLLASSDIGSKTIPYNG
ncbi:MAG: DUF1906 domain-containing protein [Bacillota bacterium]|nr:DUF1906 domain-containing protein [Bacillota bacterium]